MNPLALFSPTSWLIHIVGSICCVAGGFFYGMHVTADHYAAKTAADTQVAVAHVQAVQTAQTQGSNSNAQANFQSQEHRSAAYVAAVRDDGRLRVSCARSGLPDAAASATAVDSSAPGVGDGGTGRSEINLDEVAGRILALGQARDTAVAELRSCQRDLSNDRLINPAR